MALRLDTFDDELVLAALLVAYQPMYGFISGIVNIYIAGTTRRFAFSNTFVGLLALKIAALSAMYVLLTLSSRAEAMLASSDQSQIHRGARRLIMFNLGIIGLGGLALLLGLWLLGS